jgi:hypothetical protein
MRLRKRRHQRIDDIASMNPTFSTGQITTLVVAILLAFALYPVAATANPLLGVVITDPAGTNKAHVDGSGNLQVAGSVTVANAPMVQLSIPAGQFSAYVPSVPGLVSGPDPAGTNYAITSVTFANGGSTGASGDLIAVYATTSDCQDFSGQVLTSLGPVAAVPPGDTVHLSFPQPFVIAAAPGGAACLQVEESAPELRAVVVGYTF